MDINLVREAVLMLALACFIGIVGWAYRPSRRARFERAALSVLEDDDRGADMRGRWRADAQAGKG